MQNTPKSLRLHIAILGRTNAGKSSFLNLLTGQQTAITSPIAGTTTDVVEKAQELPPLGPVLWLDTAGYDDNTSLSAERLNATEKTFARTDIAVLVCAGDSIGAPEQQIIEKLKQHNIPLIKVYNQADKYKISQTDGIIVNSTDISQRDRILNELTMALIKLCPEDYISTTPLLGDLLPPHSTAVMIIPIDYEAPKGRLILPQVMAIRDCLDHNQNVLMVKEDDYASALQNFQTPPTLVVCDSQVVDKMVEQTPTNIHCTTFSILMARFKGDLFKMVEGAATIRHLQDNDKILIAESCTHHAADDDIGRVKIPNLLRNKTGKNLQIDYVSGCDFANNLADYKLVIQCGGCMINRRQILSRIQQCQSAGLAITNYGVCISELKGVLERVLSPFPEILKIYRENK
jgi:[FeFe] hydrogenase H-cluster maturation GTPase HydF